MGLRVTVEMAVTANDELQESNGVHQILPGTSRFAHFCIKFTLASQGFEHLLCCRGLVEPQTPQIKITPQGLAGLKVQHSLSSGAPVPRLETPCESQKGLSSDSCLRDTLPEPARASSKRGKRGRAGDQKSLLRKEQGRP